MNDYNKITKIFSQKTQIMVNQHGLVHLMLLFFQDRDGKIQPGIEFIQIQQNINLKLGKNTCQQFPSLVELF